MGRKGTNELISGEKPFIAILSNLKCLFTRLLHSMSAPALTGLMWCEFVVRCKDDHQWERMGNIKEFQDHEHTIPEESGEEMDMEKP